MHTVCFQNTVLIEISMEIGMLKFWLRLFACATVRENHLNIDHLLQSRFRKKAVKYKFDTEEIGPKLVRCCRLATWCGHRCSC